MEENKSNKPHSEKQPITEQNNEKIENLIESNGQNQAENKQQLPLNWYKFFNYFIIPIRILFYFADIVNVIEIVNSDMFPRTNLAISLIVLIPLITEIILIILYVILFSSMKTRKQNTLKLLRIAIYVPILLSIFATIINWKYIGESEQTKAITDIFCSFVWALLNDSYFAKRKEIFKN